VLAHWNNSLWEDMSLHSDTLSWLLAIQYLFLLLKAEFLSREAVNTNFKVFSLTQSVNHATKTLHQSVNHATKTLHQSDNHATKTLHQSDNHATKPLHQSVSSFEYYDVELSNFTINVDLYNVYISLLVSFQHCHILDTRSLSNLSTSWPGLWGHFCTHALILTNENTAFSISHIYFILNMNRKCSFKPYCGAVNVNPSWVHPRLLC
jgi:hypothetical protein